MYIIYTTCSRRQKHKYHMRISFTIKICTAVRRVCTVRSVLLSGGGNNFQSNNRACALGAAVQSDKSLSVISNAAPRKIRISWCSARVSKKEHYDRGEKTLALVRFLPLLIFIISAFNVYIMRRVSGKKNTRVCVYNNNNIIYGRVYILVW
jgi:hypothetical protein